MKNVKTFLIFITLSTCVFASFQRVNALGGNVGYWANDDNSWTAFPHTINNSNLAQVSGLGSADNHNAIIRWGDDTKWGFSWDKVSNTKNANNNDMINLQYGAGSYGLTFGLSMSAEDDGNISKSSLGISGSYGRVMDFGDLGVGFNYASADDGDNTSTDDTDRMGLWVNLRRAQSLCFFDNMLARFNYGSDNNVAGASTGSADVQTTMELRTSLYTHIGIADNTIALLAMGLGYESKTNTLNTKDVGYTIISLPTWIFAVESAMTDWATCRMGVNAGYELSKTLTAPSPTKNITSRGGMTSSFAVGLGFNYGSFNLDVDVSESLFTNPVQHVVGQASISPNNATATLTYAW